MKSSVTYEKVYFHDDYRHLFEDMCGRFRGRVQKALNTRPIDHNPTPNATTIVYLHDDADGGVHITTGDFVQYFNRRYGANDRIGAMRRSIEVAEKKAEKNLEAIKQQRAAEQKEKEERGIARRIRSAGRRLAFVHAVFALMLVLSVVMLSGSFVVLDRVESEVAELEGEAAVLEMATPEEGVSFAAVAAELSLEGGDSVEIYPAEKDSGLQMSTLLNALAALGGK